MGDLLADGMDWLAEQHKAHVSQTVSYKRRDVAAVDLQATLGETQGEQQGGEGGLNFVVRATDWLFVTADLTAASLMPPQNGDLITASVAGESQTFEVLPRDGDAVWRNSDGFGKRIRVHAIKVS